MSWMINPAENKNAVQRYRYKYIPFDHRSIKRDIVCLPRGHPYSTYAAF